MKSQKGIAAWSPTLMRVALGGIVFVYGIGKLLNIGPSPTGGVSGFAGFLASMSVPMPELMAWVVALVETVGALLVVVGLFTRYAAALIAVDMAAATWLVHVPNGFLAAEGGIAFTLALGLIGISLVLSGPGRLSLDYAIFGREMLPRARSSDDEDEQIAA